MRGAFTLIEVMIAVLIVSLTVWAVLGSQSQSMQSMGHIRNSWESALTVSPLISHADQRNHGKEKSMYDFLRGRYQIQYDPMIKALKALKVSYSQKEYTFISLGESNTSGELAGASRGMGLYVDRVVVKSQRGGLSAFAFRIGR